MPSANWSNEWRSQFAASLAKLEVKLDRITESQIESERRLLRSIEEMRTKVDATVERLIAKMDSQLVDVTTLKVKAGLWGGIAGLLPVIVYLAVRAIQGGK